MILQINNHLHWFFFFLSIPLLLLNCGCHISSLDSGSSRSVFCLPFYLILVFSVFTVPANAGFSLTFTLEGKTWLTLCSWRIEHHKSGDRLAVQRKPTSRSLLRRVVHTAVLGLLWPRWEKKHVNLICSSTLPLALCHCQFDNATGFSFYTGTNHLEW